MGKRYALCIGINEYVNAGPINLRFARADAEDLGSALRDTLRGGFDEVHELLDEQAAKVSIRQAIDDLLQSPLRQPDDLILLFFSGHGVRDRQGDLCLVPSDFRRHVDGSPDFSSLLHAKELEVSLGNSNVQNVILLIDCCHSGALGRVIGRSDFKDDSNLFVIGAARASEPAFEVEILRHGAFTECLLRALNLPPDKGEWITLGQIVTFIGDEVKKFKTAQLIQSTSRYVDLGITIARNPSYSISSTEFTREVIRIFELANYNIQQLTTQHNYPNFFVARLQTGFRPSQTGVLCLDDRQVKVANAHVEQFKSLIRQLHADHEIAGGMLITVNDLPAMKRRDIEAFGITSWSTSVNLLRNLIDFNRYLRRLVDEFEQDGLDRPGEPAPIKYYVDLEAEIQDTKKKKLALDFIKAWISRTGGPQLAVLGEYGSGKTTLCKKLAYDLATGFLQATRKGNHRIPILIPLLEFPRGRADIEAFITGHLARRCGVSNPNFEAFKAMNDAGFLLLIFDGLDEMSVHVDEEVIYANLAQIEQLAASPDSRVLLTSRPEYFKTTQEERRALQPTGLLARRSHYTILNLCGFSEEQVRVYLQKRIPISTNSTQDWSYYYSQIKRIHDLSDLSTRPVLLEMIVKTLPELMASEQPVDRPLLYQTYLEGELQRQSVEKRRGLLIRREDRLRTMQTLALHFYLEAPIGLTAELVRTLVHDQLSPEQLDELEAHTRDFLTCSFLTRKGDFFAFSHRSFVEYLTARALYEEIESNTPNHFGKRKLTREVIEFLAEMRPDLDVLRGWFEATRYRGFDGVRYLGTNSITLLVKLGEDLSRSDFSGTVLNEADLRHGVFEKSIFAQASLSCADLTGATLDHCNFVEADFAKARLVSVKARECTFKGAFFDLTDLTGADLSGSDLSDCIFYEADFRDVIADGCTIKSLDGILNPSSSLNLLMVDVSGRWIKRVDKGYEMRLLLDKESLDRISGKLIIGDHEWIEFHGSLQQGRYILEGTRFVDRAGFVLTEQLLSGIRSYDIPNSVLEVLKSWKSRRFRSKGHFLASLRKELNVREQWLERREKDLEKLKRKLEWLDREVKKEKSKSKTKGDRRKFRSLEERFRNAEDAYNRYKEEFDRRRRVLEEDNLDGDYIDKFCQRIATHIDFKSLTLSTFVTTGGRYTGWLTMTPGDHAELLLYLAAPRKMSYPETPWVFIKAAR